LTIGDLFWLFFIFLVHYQETMSILGFPLFRYIYIDIDDAENVLWVLTLTGPSIPVDLVFHIAFSNRRRHSNSAEILYRDVRRGVQHRLDARFGRSLPGTEIGPSGGGSIVLVNRLFPFRNGSNRDLGGIPQQLVLLDFDPLNRQAGRHRAPCRRHHRWQRSGDGPGG